MNIIRNYCQVQGMTNPADAVVQPVRDLGVRSVSIENSGDRIIGVAIMLYPFEAVRDGTAEKPDIQFWIEPRKIKYLAVNPPDCPLQFIHLFDRNKHYIGHGGILRSDSNGFVIRDGINETWIQPFRHSRVWSAQK